MEHRNTEHNCSMLRFAWALDRAAWNYAYQGLAPGNIPVPISAAGPEASAGWERKTYLWMPDQERHPTAATCDADNTKNSIKMTN
jgi:hypothetical protein